MSSKHFEVAFDGKAGRLRDLDSSNGTVRNRLRVLHGGVSHGDRIRAGQTVFRVRIEDEPADAESTSPKQAVDQSQPGRTAASSAAAVTSLPEEQEWMTLVNTTSFSFAPLHGRVDFPKHSLTLIVKGTFQMKHGGVATPLEQSSPVTGELTYQDDEGGDGSHRYPNDFVHYKPKADLLLVGRCYPPGGEPVDRCRVVFRIGEREKALEVFGSREWQPGLINDSPGEAKPFDVMELRYERAFGGSGYEKNPVGKGAALDTSDAGKKIRPLPNVEDPTSLIRSPTSKPEPAGFGPIGALWQQRTSKLGTYDEQWLKTRWPWFAEDFDYEYFNVAPSDLQLEEYLRGDEKLNVENMHPQHSQYECRLPGVRARCFVLRRADGKSNGEEFSETPLKLDTLWVDMEAEIVELVWRGVVEVVSPEFSEVRRVCICAEPLSDSPASLGQCERKFDTTLSADLESEELTEDVSAPETPNLEDMDVDQLIAETNDEIRAAMQAAGITYEIPVPEPTPESIAEEARVLKELGIDEQLAEAPEPLLTREQVAARAAAGEKLAGQDLSGMNLSGLSLPHVDFSGAVLSGVNCQGTDLAGANFVGATLVGADLTGAILDGAELSGAVLDDAVIDQASIVRANLQSVQAIAATFVQSDLTGVDASQARFDGADFSESLLDHASFRTASLVEASAVGGVGFQADFTAADLTNFRADDAVFVQASFSHTKAADSVWEGANLEAADFAHADLEAAVFVKALMRSSTISAARLRTAQLTAADLRESRLDHADLFEAQLDGAQLQGANLSGASLYGAEFTEAQLDGANLEQANLAMSSLAATLK